ncbi:hypothetical protein HU200_016885 [Digitaria exilis]|uniref:NAC domain-containing protein n=1 Tax=Digitaria exilis TaxID=1010633 RepID=A0A835KJQ0_9POAL|nr:hypothetical protein HU200_016885 [Digitaria exilis]CAB3491080.1 unnamed protein product [Digitaria exilis]
MEASRFGFNLPSAYKFDPTDAEIVAHYLLPRAAGVTNFPYAHVLIDDDTCSCPPWELLRRHGHGGSDHAFFVGPPGDPSVNGGRTSRGVHPGDDGGPGGLWRGQKGEEADLVVSGGRRGRGGEMRIRYKRYNLTYYSHGETKTSGWVMHEYHILEPKMIPGAVLSRVKITERAKKKAIKNKRKAAAAAAAGKKKVVVPGPDQAGPSNYLAVVGDDIGDRDDAAFVATSDGSEGTSGGGAQSDGVFEGGDGIVGYVVGETTTGGYYTDFLNAGQYYFNPDQPGPCSSSYLVDDHSTGNGIALKDGDAGTSGGGTGEVTGINGYTDFYNYDDYFKEELGSYFNQSEGSGGDFFTGEARQQ